MTAVADSAFDGQPAAHWDAGELGCGDLVLELRLRVAELAAGQILQVQARDLGAAEDIPAWCRVTGHTLVRASPPEYWIRKRT